MSTHQPPTPAVDYCKNRAVGMNFGSSACSTENLQRSSCQVQRASGLEVHVPRLPTCNEARPPNAGLADDTNLIRSYIESIVLAGRTVVPIGYSYGAQVMTNAPCGLGLETRSSHGLKGGVSDLIYMAGYVILEGMCTFDKTKELSKLEDVHLVFDMAEDNTMVLRNAPLVMGLTDSWH